MSLTVTSALLILQSSQRYPDLELACCPAAHCDEMTVPVFGELPNISDENSFSVPEDDEEVVLSDDATHAVSQKEQSDLVHDLSLSKASAE